MRAFLLRYRLPLVWGAVLLLSCVLQTFTALYDSRAAGRPLTLTQAVILEGTSHVMWVVLLPAIYWLQKRLPIHTSLLNILAHAGATVPVSLAHVLGMVGLRHLAFAALGAPYAYGFTLEHLLYEYRKDAMTYLIFAGAYVALNYVFARVDERLAPPEPQPEPQPEPPAEPQPAAGARLSRFAVRKKDREVLVSAQDIGWIEAAGNYAILHVGGEKHEIRSSLARLEGELDPASFVRVHKSAIVNIARVREVEPWISGDWRIRLQDGTEVPLSRRYRARFEEKAPVRR
ncbi:MAG: LytTR family DNA-binding domain-containing protein [Reyranellaceae bacterium]